MITTFHGGGGVYLVPARVFIDVIINLTLSLLHTLHTRKLRFTELK